MIYRILLNKLTNKQKNNIIEIKIEHKYSPPGESNIGVRSASLGL